MLPDGRVWLRVASASWKNPLDSSYAEQADGYAEYCAGLLQHQTDEVASSRGFPSARSKASPVWRRPLSLGAWLYARQWTDIGLATQAEPRC